MRLITTTRAFRLIQRESANYLMELRDMRRVHRCSLRVAVGKLARLYHGAVRSAR